MGEMADFGASFVKSSANLVSTVVESASPNDFKDVKDEDDDFDDFIDDEELLVDFKSAVCWICVKLEDEEEEEVTMEVEEVSVWNSSTSIMGVAGGVWVSDGKVSGEFIISEPVESAEEEQAEEGISPFVDDFEEESILSVLLRLPPMPDSGVGTLRDCFMSFSWAREHEEEDEAVLSSLQLNLLSSFSAKEFVMLASEESDDIQVDVTISLNMSRDDAPPKAHEFEEFESLREFELEQGLGVTVTGLVLLMGDIEIVLCGEFASELVIEAGVEASRDKSAAEETEMEFELKEDDDDDEEEEEEHSLFKILLLLLFG